MALEHATTHHNTLKQTATQHTATLKHTTTHCNTLQRTHLAPLCTTPLKKSEASTGMGNSPRPSRYSSRAPFQLCVFSILFLPCVFSTDQSPFLRVPLWPNRLQKGLLLGMCALVFVGVEMALVFFAVSLPSLAMMMHVLGGCFSTKTSPYLNIRLRRTEDLLL